MKIYLIYVTIPNLTPMLYGFTNQKEIVELFEQQRNMELYKVIKKELTKDQWFDLNKNHGSLIMRVRGLKTSNSHHIYSDIKIAMTEQEDMDLMVKSDDISKIIDKEYTKISWFVDMLNNNIKESIYNLSYSILKGDIDLLELFIFLKQNFISVK